MTDPVRIITGTLLSFIVLLIGIALMSQLLPEITDGPFAGFAYVIIDVFELIPYFLVGGTIATIGFIVVSLRP